MSGPESVGDGLWRTGSRSSCLRRADKRSTPGVIRGSRPDADGEEISSFQGDHDSWSVDECNFRRLDCTHSVRDPIATTGHVYYRGKGLTSSDRGHRSGARALFDPELFPHRFLPSAQVSSICFSGCIPIGCHSESVWRCHFSSPSGTTDASGRNDSRTETARLALRTVEFSASKLSSSSVAREVHARKGRCFNRLKGCRCRVISRSSQSSWQLERQTHVMHR